MVEQKVLKERRLRLIQGMPRNSVMIIPGGRDIVRNGDVEYRLRQLSDFAYLVGQYDEADAVAILISGDEKHLQGRFILFNLPKDIEREIWTGPRIGQEAACKEYGADEAYSVERLKELMPGLLAGRQCVYYPKNIDSQVKEWAKESQSLVNPPKKLKDSLDILHEMRVFKGPEEIAAMRKAIEISSRAQIRAMKFCKPDLYEYEIQAEIIHEYLKSGCFHVGYEPIIAGGVGATTLHYIRNDRQLVDGELLLVDAGAEHEGLVADLTRVWPVNGKFSKIQRQLYQLVLDAQLAAIAAVKPGNLFIDPHKAAVKVLVQGLVKLGILKGNVDEIIEKRTYKILFPHGTSHWLGMDVHDVGLRTVSEEDKDHYRKLEPGMVLTVEPGLYFNPNVPGFHELGIDKVYWNIGIRIEDDILVKDGPVNLSQGLIKTVEEIERIMAR